MSRRFRPFYVAAAAVIMVGVYGTRVVPRSEQTILPESVSVQPTAAPETATEWLGPQETPSLGLLNLSNSLSVLPFDIAQ